MLILPPSKRGNPLYISLFDKDSLSPAKFQIWVHLVSTGLVGRSYELLKKEVVMAKGIILSVFKTGA